MTEDQLQNGSALANTFRMLQKHGIWRQVPLVLALLVSGALEGIGIGTLLPILKAVASGPSAKHGHLERIIFAGLDFLHIPKVFGALVLVFSVCMTLRAVISMLTSRYVSRMVAEIATDLRKEVLTRVLDARWSYFTVNPVGRFIAAVGAEANWASYVYKTSLNVLSYLIRALIYCGVGLLIDWRAAIVAIGMGLGLGLINRYFIRIGRRAGRSQQLAMRSLVSDFSDAITGFKPLKAMYRHETLVANLVQETGEIRRSMYDMVLSQQLANALPDFLVTTALVIAAYICYRVLHLDLSALLISGVIVMRLIANVSAVQRSLQETATAESSYWSLHTMIHEATEAAESFPSARQPTLNIACRFDRVDFSYGSKPVLKQVSLEIPAGRITTLVGESGSGKTTIADLLLGLFVVNSGSITLDGIPLAEIDVMQWREMIGYVPQEVLLFNNTIFENVALGDPEITEERVRAALEDAGALDFVDALPRGIHAPVGERGTMLSGGQRQRIALARALILRPILLILDEATSALDPVTEAEICETVRRQAGKLTVLAITHQPAWVDMADRVYRIENGTAALADASELRHGLSTAR
jgi:ATP-binding cassette subfamily C protein